MGQESECRLAPCLWFKVSHEVAVKLSAGPTAPSTRKPSPQVPLHRAVSQHGVWLPPRVSDERRWAPKSEATVYNLFKWRRLLQKHLSFSCLKFVTKWETDPRVREIMNIFTGKADIREHSLSQQWQRPCSCWYPRSWLSWLQAVLTTCEPSHWGPPCEIRIRNWGCMLFAEGDRFKAKGPSLLPNSPFRQDQSTEKPGVTPVGSHTWKIRRV